MKRRNVFKPMIIGMLMLMSCCALLAQKGAETLNRVITRTVYASACDSTETADFAEVYDNTGNVAGDLRVAVWSDVHILPPALIGNNTQSPDFLSAIAGDRKMFAESAAILEAAVAQIKIDAPDVLIIPGDLTKDGERVSHEYLAAKLNEVKAALPDIRIYVINGNHDVNNNEASVDYSTTPSSSTPTVTPAEFREIYTGFGYGEDNHDYYTPPAGKQAGGLSYVARPQAGFTFIAIDAGKYSADATKSGLDEHETAGNITPDLMNWIVEKVAEAKATGDFIFGMVHQGLVPHFSLEPVYLAEYLTDNYEEDASILSDAGLRYVFTGHMHANDIASVTTPQGNTLYDIETGALVTYPSPTRLIGISIDTITRDNHILQTETVTILTRMIKEIDYTDPSTGEPITDLTVYGRQHSLQPAMVIGLLQGAVLNDLIDDFIEMIDTIEITTSAANTHTGSYALIESMLAPDNNDLGAFAMDMIAQQLLDTIDIPLSEIMPIRIYFDDTQEEPRIVINITIDLFSGELYITETALIRQLEGIFTQLDTAYLQKKPFLSGLLNRVLLHVLTLNFEQLLPCNSHTLIDAALRAYLGHLGGEELQPQWVMEIVNGFDVAQHNDTVLNWLLNETIQYAMDVELPCILTGITLNLDSLITGDTTLMQLLPLLFDSSEPAIGDLLSAFEINITDLAGTLNSSIIPDEYKLQIGELFSGAINSFLFDINYTEDNITNLSRETVIANTAIPNTVDDNNILFYPNPVTEELYIKTNLTVTNVDIYDVYGKLIKQIEGNQTVVRLNELSAGIYLIKLWTAEGPISVKRIIKS